MTIGEVINMLMKIFAYLGEIFGGMFGSKEEGEGEETTDAPTENA